MTIFTVTTANDVVASDGKLSLREAVSRANELADRDTILFASGLEGATLTLTGGELVLRQDVTIDGDDLGITLSGGDTQRIIRTSGSGTDVTLTDITLSDGRVEVDQKGGAIFVGGGGLALNGSAVRGSVSGNDGDGGGIYASPGSRLLVENSAIVGNSSGGLYVNGGGIAGNNIALTVRDSSLTGNCGEFGGAVSLTNDSNLVMEGSIASDNGWIAADALTFGGAISLSNSSATISRSSLIGNRANFGGAIDADNSLVQISDSTIAGNLARHNGFYSALGGGIKINGSSYLAIRNTSITGNTAYLYSGRGEGYVARGGGIHVGPSSRLDIANSVFAGNTVRDPEAGQAEGPDIFGAIAFSNGHNIFGSDIAGSVVGDRENVDPATVFAKIDPDTGGGQLDDSGIVPLLNSKANPALSGGDPLAAGATDQLGTVRPLPAGSLPDIGAVELNQPLSTTASANNDVLTGTSSANTIRALAGADYLKGLAGNDTLYGGDQGDLLDGGRGNDKLYGDSGVDLVVYTGDSKVTVDLSLSTDKATRGSEVDTLYNIEGAIGSNGADTFKGNEFSNFFQGGRGKDTFTGNATSNTGTPDRDLYDFNATAESGITSTTRDLIKDFAVGVDKLDLMGIDADNTLAGNQTFRWVGSAALSGPGELGYFISNGDTIVRASNDADATAEFQIELTGLKDLGTGDFFL